MIKKLYFLAVTGFISACSMQPTLPDIPDNPSTEWVSQHIDTYQAAVEKYPDNTELKKQYAAILELKRFFEEQKQFEEHKTRELTVSWREQKRSGAAYNQEAYIHVLGSSKSQDLVSTPATGMEPKDGHIYSKALQTLNSISEPTRYSTYELSRWERYCSQGKGMDFRDWSFVQKEGLKYPAKLFTNCTPPNYTYSDYIDAWQLYCHERTINTQQNVIIEHSYRPTNASCPRLKINYGA